MFFKGVKVGTLVPCSSTLGGTMKLFVRLIVFLTMVWIPGVVGFYGGFGATLNIYVGTFLFFVCSVAGYLFSGRAMDAVAGKLPQDEQ